MQSSVCVGQNWSLWDASGANVRQGATNNGCQKHNGRDIGDIAIQQEKSEPQFELSCQFWKDDTKDNANLEHLCHFGIWQKFGECPSPPVEGGDTLVGRKRSCFDLTTKKRWDRNLKTRHNLDQCATTGYCKNGPHGMATPHGGILVNWGLTNMRNRFSSYGKRWWTWLFSQQFDFGISCTLCKNW